MTRSVHPVPGIVLVVSAGLSYKRPERRRMNSVTIKSESGRVDIIYAYKTRERPRPSGCGFSHGGSEGSRRASCDGAVRAAEAETLCGACSGFDPRSSYGATVLASYCSILPSTTVDTVYAFFPDTRTLATSDHTRWQVHRTSKECGGRQRSLKRYLNHNHPLRHAASTSDDYLRALPPDHNSSTRFRYRRHEPL